MNFDYSEEEKALKEQVRRLLAGRGGTQAARRVLEGEGDGGAAFDRTLWVEMARLGWLGAAIPTGYGGQGLGYAPLCAIAEELGRGLAAVPTVSSIYLAAEALLLAGSEAQKRRFLPAIAQGELVGTLALVEGVGALMPAAIRAHVRARRLEGTKLVADGGIAGLAIVAARDETGAPRLYLADLTAPGVRRESIASIDPSRPWSRLSFDAVPVDPLGEAGGVDWATLERVLQRAAVLVAFEQLGGADRCLELAREHALQREAFGRIIGQYQAVKHRLADMYVANELARSNAYYGAWALDSGPDELPMAAAVSRIAACEAFERAARDLTQTLGGIAATWVHEAHLYYRRSRLLAVQLGTAGEWRDRLATLVDRIVAA